MISKRMKKGIICDALVLRECFLSAKQSITFHGKGESSYLKQAGHCCFWIAKLKPMSLAIGAGEFAGQLVRGKRGLLGTSRVDLIPAIEEAAKVNENRVSPVFPVNEYCGVLVGHTMAVAGLKQLADRARRNNDPETDASIRRDIATHQARFSNTAKRLVKSLRFNNYSARATATMFEWVYDRPEGRQRAPEAEAV
jgi:hypothetical protein